MNNALNLILLFISQVNFDLLKNNGNTHDCKYFPWADPEGEIGGPDPPAPPT